MEPLEEERRCRSDIINKTRVPYFGQSVNTAIENVMFVARAVGNPASYTIKIDGSNLNLARVDAWKLCRGNNATIAIDTAFELALGAPQLAALEDMMIITSDVPASFHRFRELMVVQDFICHNFGLTSLTLDKRKRRAFCDFELKKGTEERFTWNVPENVPETTKIASK